MQYTNHRVYIYDINKLVTVYVHDSITYAQVR